MSYKQSPYLEFRWSLILGPSTADFLRYQTNACSPPYTLVGGKNTLEEMQFLFYHEVKQCYKTKELQFITTKYVSRSAHVKYELSCVLKAFR